MLQLDATQLYDLSEAGRLLYRDPARLAREVRLGRIPAARVDRQTGLPAPWVDAEAGTSPADPEALRIYWLARLEPPSPDARRPARARDRLPADVLLAPEEAAARLFATPAALRRLDQDGTVPSVRVDGEIRYDAALVDLVADEGDGAQADARRAEVLDWARFEYETAPAPAPPPPPDFPAPPPAEAAPEAPAAPGAYQIPSDLDLGSIDPLPPEKPQGPSRLIEADGFETIDED